MTIGFHYDCDAMKADSSVARRGGYINFHKVPSFTEVHRNCSELFLQESTLHIFSKISSARIIGSGSMDRRLEKYEILRMVNLFNKTHPNDKIFINEYVNLQSGEGSDIMKILDDRERRINVEADPVRTQAITAKSFVDGILKIDGIEERRAFPWESAESSLKVLISMVTKTRRKFDRERLQALGGPRVPGSRKVRFS